MSGEPNTAGAGVVLSSFLATERRTNSTKGVFEMVAKPLHQAIRLRMVFYHLPILDVQLVAQGGPQGGGELGTTF